ncbi:MAG: hypothetical protein IT378_02510 [Sandaracinaceae bacterium]|nr:hypothetical protein [Sandaracinaceae bacterium]
MSGSLDIATSLLERTERVKSDRVRGFRGDHEIEVRFVDRGAGSTRDPYTEVLVLDRTRDDLHLSIVRQTDYDMAYVRRGLGTDLEVGDAIFDELFLVEAAPADVIPHLLDGATRALLQEWQPIGVKTLEAKDDQPGGLLVEKPTWLGTPQAIEAMLAIAVHIVDRIPLAFAQADRARAERHGYRGTSPAEDDRRAEVASLKKKQKERHDARVRLGCLGLLAFFVLLAIFTALVVWATE